MGAAGTVCRSRTMLRSAGECTVATLTSSWRKPAGQFQQCAGVVRHPQVGTTGRTIRPRTATPWAGVVLRLSVLPIR